MNLASLSHSYRVVTLALSVVAVVAGVWAYGSLGRLEDPAFPIKQAVITTPYTGATPAEVADEVTDPLEEALLQMGKVDYVTSQSMAGRSVIKVYIRDRFGAEQLPQVWDELRRKVAAAELKLPPGAGKPVVNDDFGDVYGVLYYLHGDGFSLAELDDYARFLRDELLLVEGVGRVSTLGEPREAIYVDFQPERLARLGADLNALLQALQGQAMVTPAGEMELSGRRVSLRPAGTLDTAAAVADLTFPAGDGRILRLGEVARVERGLLTPPSTLLRYNDRPAITLGVSTVAGGNVVEMGKAVQARIAQLKQQTPVGIEFGVVSMQSDSVEQAVAGFTLGLVESVVIVVGVLLVAMGLRAGLLIGGVLLLTILGTFLAMRVLGTDLQRISLGALIIALGMLVDNAIVIVEGMIAGRRQGVSLAEASRRVVGQTAWPLAGATLIAVLAFAPIGLSPDNTGDYCGSLFTVIWVSLGLSWLFAVTSTPVIGAMVLGSAGRGKAGNEETPGGAYDGPVFRAFASFLAMTLRNRWKAVGLMILLLGVSVVGFGKARQGFFPASARPQFLVDYWAPQGTSVESVDAQLSALAEYVGQLEGVTAVASSAGAGTLRFELTYGPESPNPSFGQLIVSVSDAGLIDGLTRQVRDRVREAHPDALAWPWRMVLGPGGEAKIQARLRGSDPNELRRLGEQVEAVFAADPYAANLRTDWRNRVLTLAPQFDEAQAARLGVTREQVGQALQLSTDGVQAGLVREKDMLLPVKVRARPASGLQETAGNANAANTVDAGGTLPDIRVFTASGRTVPLEQVSRAVDVGWEDAIVARRGRAPTLIVKCDPAVGPAGRLFERLRPQVEAIALPAGYTLEWGGEYENQSKASGGLKALLPVCFGGMALVLLALFNNLRQPLIILLTVPLAIIGVTIGLLGTGAEFGFMAILGTLSLAGMLIKNAIVLIDEANAQVGAGLSHYDAIVASAVSRARPVTLAALTTVLGMLPLLTDVFFKDMAVVIIFGLSFATLLTLVVVPVLYAILYNARPEAALAAATTRP
ncbi:MAG: efflux RND transporter permease subunit [Phycisphaerae bacterium]